MTWEVYQSAVSAVTCDLESSTSAGWIRVSWIRTTYGAFSNYTAQSSKVIRQFQGSEKKTELTMLLFQRGFRGPWSHTVRTPLPWPTSKCPLSHHWVCIKPRVSLSILKRFLSNFITQGHRKTFPFKLETPAENWGHIPLKKPHGTAV